MSDFTIFPAIDLRRGMVVRLSQGQDSLQKTYAEDPAKTARQWFDQGAKWIHVVNLDGAFGEASSENQAALSQILAVAQGYRGSVQFGGGLRTIDSVKRAIDAGIQRVVIGTAAITTPDIVEESLKSFGDERIAVGIDTRNGLVCVRGWVETSEETAVRVGGRLRAMGLKTVIYTDIARDGMQTGINLEATEDFSHQTGLEVVASGGVRDQKDVLLARQAKLSGIIIGRALYEGGIRLEDVLKV